MPKVFNALQVAINRVMQYRSKTTLIIVDANGTRFFPAKDCTMYRVPKSWKQEDVWRMLDNKEKAPVVKFQ